MPRVLLATILILAVASGGCGTTSIITNDKHARIFVDGEMVGRGHGTITKRGVFGDTLVIVKAPDGRSERQQISRSFTALTLLFGIFTYGICLFACWEYPDSVYVELDLLRPSGGSEAAGADPWLMPPAGWKPPADTSPSQ